jgi:hypothetical protein
MIRRMKLPARPESLGNSRAADHATAALKWQAIQVPREVGNLQLEMPLVN